MWAHELRSFTHGISNFVLFFYDICQGLYGGLKSQMKTKKQQKTLIFHPSSDIEKGRIFCQKVSRHNFFLTDEKKI